MLPQLISGDLVATVAARMDAVLDGEYETGIAPYRRFWNPGDDPSSLRKVDDSHFSDRAILELVSSPAIGRWAAAVTGAGLIQLWSCQLLDKPAAARGAADVGWHQDLPYWSKWWDGDVLTAWVAISDVTQDAGAVRFVAGSHTWGRVEGGDFFEPDLSAAKDGLRLPAGATWRELTASMHPGQVSLHHCMTLHGSGPNVSGRPRKAFALHLRTERAVPKRTEDVHYVTGLDDLQRHPILYRADSELR